jgi:nucleoside-diphosphate-sugar epimerase
LKILVTGDRGYIGTVLVPNLQRLGHEVTGYDTEYYFDGDLSLPPRGYPRIRKDIRDVTCDDLMGFGAVIHLAALSNDPLGDLNPELTYEINYQSTVRLAQIARDVGVKRFLYSSSCSLYGTAGDEILKEDASLHPLTPYAESKVRSEEALSKLASRDFAPVYLRNATVYGASPRLRLDIVLNNLVGWAVTTGTIRIMSDGTPWRPMAHVQDISQAFSCALEAPLEVIRDQAFNVGTDSENYKVSDLAAVARDVVGNCSIEYGTQVCPDPRNYQVDFSKLARTFPNFHPRWNAREGARELCAAYRAAGMTQEDFQGRKFTRLKQLCFLMESGRLNGMLRWRAEKASAAAN